MRPCLRLCRSSLLAFITEVIMTIICNNKRLISLINDKRVSDDFTLSMNV